MFAARLFQYKIVNSLINSILWLHLFHITLLMVMVGIFASLHTKRSHPIVQTNRENDCEVSHRIAVIKHLSPASLNAYTTKDMPAPTKIIILYNPISTGPSRENAEDFANSLEGAGISRSVIDVRKTDYAGHGEKIAASVAGDDTTVIISSSGDGGYHEVINGVLHSDTHGAATSLLPSGNANDHYNALKSSRLLEKIAAFETTTIDVLQIDAVIDGSPQRRFAHSYAGIGVTPQIGKKLTEAKLNPITEIFLVIKNLFRVSPVKIAINGKTYRYTSLVFSNISRMSKVLNLSDKASVTDGKFEITGSESSSIINLLRHLFAASVLGLKDVRQEETFQFRTLRPLTMQLDGEVYSLASNTDVTITCRKKILTCIL